MTAALLVLAVALIPAIPLAQVSSTQLARARSYWLLGVLTATICWLAWSELWLAMVGFAFLCRWRNSEPLPSLVQWVAIGGCWWFLLKIPVALYEWVPWGWLAIALWQVAVLAERYWRIRRRMVGTFGSPAITAMYLALTAAFAPWWLWPALAVGFLLTCSWLAFLAVGLAVAWLWPVLAVPLVGVGGLVFLLWAWSPTVCGHRIGEWTLRGDTLDSVWARLAVWRIVADDLSRERAWGFGIGPNQAHKKLRVWSSRVRIELPHECHMEAVQMLYEYGVVGLVAVGAFLWRVGPHLVVGDPWSAAWLAGCVLSLGHWPMRHPTIGPAWLAISARVVLG